MREVVVGLDSVLLRLEPGGDPAAAVRAFAAGHLVGRGYLELTGYGEPLRLR